MNTRKRYLGMFSRVNTASPNYWGFKSGVHLDIGCGNFARNPFKAGVLYGADISPVVPQNLEKNQFFQVERDGFLPFANESLDSISGYDFIEHLSRDIGNPNIFITFMNEASRVLKPGGLLLCVTPAFPAASAFQDPTHVNIITENTVSYFLKPQSPKGALDYGISANFELLEQFWVGAYSQIRKQDWDSAGFSVKKLILPFTSVSSLRAFIAGAVKPTHLVWLLKKHPEQN